MLARMEMRKGIHELIEAWPGVEDSLAQAEITIIGGGPESEIAAAWASGHPGRRFLGEMDHPMALAEVSRASVLVLPSVRDGRWREQIGLPIHEALLGGLTVVTTDETGLAPWLSSHGHRVVALSAIGRELAPALIDALEHPLDRRSVVASLPVEDGRVVANHRMHEVGGHGV
jgi:glycosyltransferase involved in cell wall biosynthesis